MKKKKRNEHGHIAKRGENKYLVRWRENGKQVSKVVVGDYGRALAFLAHQLNPKQNEPAKPAERTFGSYATDEWAKYTADKWKLSTQTTQGSLVKRHIEPYFGLMMLGTIKPVTIVAFHAAMERKGLGKRTRRNLHSILTRIFSYALELELIEKSPLKRGIAPKLEHTEKPPLNEEQLFALLDAVPICYRAFYMTLALTGIRTGEALGLKWQDVDFADSSLNVRRAIYRGKETTPKTANSIRPRPVVPELHQALLHHRTMAAYTQPTDYVFASSSGRALNPDLLRKTMQAALKIIGVKFNLKRADGLHLLRHTSGSVIYRRSGGDLKTTQEWLGHSSSRITADVYVHSLKGGQRTAAEALSRAVFSPPSTPTTGQIN
jgi:integrase